MSTWCRAKCRRWRRFSRKVSLVSSSMEFVNSTMADSVSSTLCRAYSAELILTQYTGRPAQHFIPSDDCNKNIPTKNVTQHNITAVSKSAAWWVKNETGKKLQFSNKISKFLTEFQQMAANFQQKRLWVLKN